MRRSLGTGTMTETQILSLITLACYTAALVTIAVLGHSLFELTLRAARLEIIAVYTLYAI